MEAADQEYAIVPWNTETCETECCTLKLPARECIVQLEVPLWVTSRIREEANEYGISMEKLLAEKLEYNMAELAVENAREATCVDRTKTFLSEAREYISSLRILDTTAIEKEITTVWAAELN